MDTRSTVQQATERATAEPSAFVERSDYRVDILARRNRVTVSIDGEPLAESQRCLLVDEQDHGLVFYFPPEDVRLDLFVPDEQTSRCPYKGTATYRRYERDGDDVLIWSYEDPYPEVARLAGYVGFFQDAVEVRIGQAHPAVSGR
ncbi:MAG: DUF427 domain-containing protein [Acidimicrobiales bacterium]|jgi:uncharacterized protein (DUF427 family)